MDAFLSRVSKTIIKQHKDLSNLVFILPNQRSGVYLQEALKKELTSISFLPEIITFDNLAEQIANISKTASVELLFNFYSVYKDSTNSNKIDSFEEFSGWATIVLDDFNEIDANLVDSKSLFSNLKAINEIHNWNPDTELTQNYLTFLRKLEDYYTAFYAYLIKNNKGYQGLIYREAVKVLEHFVNNTKKNYIFAGFNFLKKSESQIIQTLLEENKAHVYWNISEDLIKSNNNAGRYIRGYKNDWHYYQKNRFDWINTSKFLPENTTIIGASKNVGAAKLISKLLIENDDVGTTAVVLPSQSVLLTVLNSIPHNTKAVNITMGYPLLQSSLSNLIDQYYQIHIQSGDHAKGYYHKLLLKIVQHPIIYDTISFTTDLVEFIHKENKIYLTFTEIEHFIKSKKCKDCALLLELLSPIASNDTENILNRLLQILLLIKNSKANQNTNVLYKHYELTLSLKKLIGTYQFIKNLKELKSLYNKLLHTERITYIGKAEEGVQVMGLLEAQNGSFDHLILTSLNEGVLPKNKQRNSFIPFDLKLEFGLPTYRDEDAISSYHFFSLLESSKKISLIYNTETDSFGGGEISRFLIQLLWQYPSVTTQLVNPNLKSLTTKTEEISKNRAVLERLKNLAKKGFSPSALASYLYNPLEFYYQKVLGIYKADEVEEIVASNTMGTILHAALEDIYKPYVGKYLSVDALQKDYTNCGKTVEKHYATVYKNGDISEGMNKLTFEVVVHFVKRFIQSEIKSLRQGKKIKIIALEKSYKSTIEFSNLNFPVKIHGEIDRIDLMDGVLRIIDYKSGKVNPSHLRLDDLSKISKDYKYSKALQVLIYAYLYTSHIDFDFSKQIQVGIISFKNLKFGFMPVNFSTGKKKEFTLTKEHINQFLEELEVLLIEIFNPTISFTESV